MSFAYGEAIVAALLFTSTVTSDALGQGIVFGEPTPATPEQLEQRRKLHAAIPECYQLYVEIPFQGMQPRDMFCSIHASTDCTMAQEKLANQTECRASARPITPLPPAPPHPTPPPSKPIECYDFYVNVPFEGVQFRKRTCSESAADQCRAMQNEYLYITECRFVSRTDPKPRYPSDDKQHESDQCWVLTYSAGAGLLTSEWGVQCGADSKNSCATAADNKNKMQPNNTGRWGCRQK